VTFNPISSHDDPFRLDGQVAIVTGGLGRLGTQYARALTTAGASVALFDVSSKRSDLLQSLVDAGAPVSTHLVDASNKLVTRISCLLLKKKADLENFHSRK